MPDISPCLRAWIYSLTAPLRGQLREILYMIKKMIEAKLAMMSALVGRNDVIAAYYQISANRINDFLKPIENMLGALPLEKLKGCNDGSQLFANIENRYWDYKAIAEDLSYKYAQFGFASNWSNKIKEELQLQLDRIDQVIDYLDSLISGTLSLGARVRIYETNQTGTVTSVGVSTVNVNLDVGGSVTVPAGDVGIIT